MAKSIADLKAYMLVFANPGAIRGSTGNIFFGVEGQIEALNQAEKMEAMVIEVKLVADYRRGVDRFYPVEPS